MRPKGLVQNALTSRWSTYSHTGSGSVGSGFRLVSDQDVDMGKDFLELNLEELRNEWSTQVQNDSLSL